MTTAIENASIEGQIQKIVREKVDEALAPYKETIAKLGAFFNMPVAHTPAPKAFVSPMVQLQIGQSVHYKQGKGTFEAKVVGTNAPNGTVKLQRADGKEVVRPMHKVY